MQLIDFRYMTYCYPVHKMGIMFCDCHFATAPYNARENISKTQVMVLSRRAARSRAEQINIQINGTTIPKQDYIKYPGVTINNNLSWSLMCKSTQKNAIAIIWRVSPYLSLATKQ